MSAEVESMFYAGREVPWHGLGIQIDEAPTSEKALEIAGLNWDVISKDVVVDGNVVPGYKANTRTSDGSVLGIVSDKYKIVQNREAFQFTDFLVNGVDTRYETAGSLRQGKTIWMLAKMPEVKILDDKVDPYVCFTNTHDGSGSVRVCMTPIRVVCNNTLNLALSSTHRAWSTRHMGNIESKMHDAKITLHLADEYMKQLSSTAEGLALEHMSALDKEKAINALFPIADDASDRVRANNEAQRAQFQVCMLAPDLINYMNTKWQFINAVSDYVTHAATRKTDDGYVESNWAGTLNGNAMLDKAFKLMTV